MFKEDISQEYVVAVNGFSEGTQIKYKKGSYWYKINKLGEEGLVEFLVSNLLRYSSLKKDEYVLYETGMINQQSGCRSAEFRKNQYDSFITYYRLYKNVTGGELEQAVSFYDTMEERFQFVINFVKESTGYDCTYYLKKVFTLDLITLNTDRHFSNLGLIYNSNDGYRDAPLFDNGLSLLNGNDSVNKNLSIEENVKRVVAKPFSGSHEKMFEYIGKGFTLDVAQACEWLSEQKESFYRDVLLYQLERYKSLFDKD